MVRRASCGLQRAAGIRVARAQAPLRWLSLGRWRNTRACRARAPCRAGDGRPTHYRRALHRRKASLLRCKTVVRRASCGLQRAAGIRVARASATALAVSREVAKHASLPRARAVLRWSVIGLRTLERYCTGGRPLSFGARPWCDVRAVASNAQPAFAWHAQAPLRWLSFGRWRNTRACRARAPCRAGCDRLTHLRRVLHRRKASLFRARPWCDVRAVTSNAQPAFAWHARKRHCAGCLSGGGEIRELAARARRAALVVVVLRTMEGHCTGGRPLSFGARPWCDVRAVTSNAQPASRARDASATALAVSREVAKHASLPRARAVPRWLGRLRTRKGTAPAEGLSLSVQDRGATCELWPPTRSRHSRGTRASATALAVSREVAKYASLPRARAVPRWR